MIRYRGWQSEAACDGMDPDLFFPAPGASYARARAVCSRCPVRGECLLSAIHDELDGHDGRHGMRGAMTPPERDEFAHRWRIWSKRPYAEELMSA